MLNPNSRYYQIGEAIWISPSGERIPYKLRRFPPQGQSLPVQSVVAVDPHERLDWLANRTLGNSELFWRIADANNAMNPFDLIQRATLRIPGIRSGQ